MKLVFAQTDILRKSNSYKAKNEQTWTSLHYYNITTGRRQSKQSRNADQKSLETVFSIAICRQSGDKWQSKTLFRTIFYLRSSIVLTLAFRLPPTRCEHVVMSTHTEKSLNGNIFPQCRNFHCKRLQDWLIALGVLIRTTSMWHFKGTCCIKCIFDTNSIEHQILYSYLFLSKTWIVGTH